MSINREAIIDVSAKIFRLRETLAKAKEDLRTCEARLDSLLAGEADIPESNLFQKVSQHLMAATLNQKIIDFLDAHPEQHYSAEDVLAAIPDANITSIRSALARLTDEEKIQRAERGRYQSRFESSRFDLTKFDNSAADGM